MSKTSGFSNLDAYRLAALVGRETEARAAIDQAITYAAAIDTPNIHVMAGFAAGGQAEALLALHYCRPLSGRDSGM